ncbi:MAG: glycosyltransferase family 39 protein [Planctomycetes bacterium]|nr:glycosyltransferase family 39 protein [Planctomycetota bacterium]
MSFLRRLQGSVLLLVALALLVAAFRVPTTPQPGGGRSLEAFWLVVLALALLPQVVAHRLGGVAAGLASLLVLAGGGACALIRPTWLHHVYLRPHELARGEAAVGLAMLALQGLVVAVLLVRDRALRAALRARVDRRLLLVFGLFLLVSGAHATIVYPHRDEPRFLIFFVLQLVAVALIALAAFGNLLLLGARLDPGFVARFRAVLDRAEAGQGLPGFLRRRLPILAALFVTTVAALISWFVFDRVPHVPDGLAYLFQAKTIAGGSFAAPAPPVPEAFQVYLMDVRGGQWYAVTNPGFPLLLALGVKLGCAWLVNPVLGGLTILASHALMRRLLDRRWADLGVILLACSPWFLFLSASLMTHLATQFFATLGAVLAIDARRAGRADQGFASGAAFGFVFLIRPLDGLLLGFVGGAILLVGWWRERQPRFAVLVAFALGALAVSSVLLMFSRALTGHWLEPPINAYIAELWPGSTNRLGFGPEVGNPPQRWGPLDPIPGHGWRDVLLNSNQNLANLQLELFGWPIGSLALLAFLVARGRLDRLSRLLLALLLLLLVGYNLYWFSGGPDFGPRYWFSMILPLVILSLRGLERLGRETDPARLGVVLAFLLVLIVPVFGGWRICGRYLDYRGFHAGYRRLLEEHPEIRGGLVFVDSPEEIDYGCAFILNDPWLGRGSTVFARDRGLAADFELMRRMKDRRIYWVEGPARSAAGVRLVPPRDR